jgi:hypothetical protein
LTKSVDDITRILDLSECELCDEPSFFAVGISADQTVDHGRFPGFRVGKVGTDSVDLDILGWKDFSARRAV